MAKPKVSKKWVSADPLEGPAILAAIKGDQDSFAFLYHLHRDKVFAYCLVTVSNEDLAKDLTQNVFMQMYRKLHTFKFEAALSTWLHRVAINVVGQHYRSLRCAPRVVASLDECVDSEEDTTLKREAGAPDPNLEMIPARIALDKAIEEVGHHRLREFFLFAQGYDYTVQAAMLGENYGTVKSRGLRARLELKKALERQLVTV